MAQFRRCWFGISERVGRSGYEVFQKCFTLTRKYIGEKTAICWGQKRDSGLIHQIKLTHALRRV